MRQPRLVRVNEHYKPCAMIEIAVLTPAADDGTYGPHWPQVMERLAAALSMADLTVRPMAWPDHVEDPSELVEFPLVLPLLAWGYHQHHARWLQATRAWAEAGVRIANAASVLAWNSDKTYLARFEQRGVAVPPTRWSSGVTAAEIEAAFDGFGTDTLIVKPTVSGGAWKTQKITRGARLVDAPEGSAMIQPFLPDLATAGELSLLFFGGRLSHAVLKTAAPGDFRIQSQFGGRYRTVAEPPAAALDLAARVLDIVEEDLLYARIDMVEHEGRWLLMEAELIEPDFYLSEAPDAGRLFAESAAALVVG
ncbi:transporter [Brevundimonas sp. AAP58]|uniref:ATP-grasp domain-containing protein n=1 Tax=Brevundimonas sp. AAP58 TaxID=1523422 RepID=UPI0006CC1C34|nr:transporter [Brevundimonas sp. AAP58]KPF77663.1 transporter [Brevundimonas sp. AAP58]